MAEKFIVLFTEKTFDAFHSTILLSTWPELSLVVMIVFILVAFALLLTPSLPESHSKAPFPPNTIILHASPLNLKCTDAFGIAPLCQNRLSLETYLRMASIKYEVVPATNNSTLLLSCNDSKFFDLHSALCYLRRTHKDLNAEVLDPVEEAATEAFFCLLYQLSLSLMHLRDSLSSKFNFDCSGSRHLIKDSRCLPQTSKGLLSTIATRIRALETLLGGDSYFMGTRTPTCLDAVAFGVLVDYILAPVPECLEGGVNPARQSIALVQFVRRVAAFYFLELEGLNWDAVEERAAMLWKKENQHGSAKRSDVGEAFQCRENRHKNRASRGKKCLGNMDSMDTMFSETDYSSHDEK